jgi:hypothetical protein
LTSISGSHPTSPSTTVMQHYLNDHMQRGYGKELTNNLHHRPCHCESAGVQTEAQPDYRLSHKDPSREGN